MNDRKKISQKERIVIKVGTSSLVHEETGEIDLLRMEQLVRIICDLKNKGKEVVLVSSGAIGVGRKALGLKKRPGTLPVKQACASVGQALLMMMYQKLFREYNHIASQILMTKHTLVREESYFNAKNTFHQLLAMDVIPIVNENDTISTSEIEIGDNDTLSAVVASLCDADLLILMSDIDGLYTGDPNKDPDAEFIECVPKIDKTIYDMAGGSASDFGTGGMVTKIDAARIATDSGCDMIIANAADFHVISDIMQGENIGTLFLAHKNTDFDIKAYIGN
jgi:glutamate 5-kinase